MQDKRKPLETAELRTVQDLPGPLKEDLFPTRVPGMCEYLEITVGDSVVGYACIDIIGGLAILHLGLLDEFKTQETIMEVVDIWKGICVPWLKASGIEAITSNCPMEDTKTAELMRTFGFQTADVTFGTYIG